MPYATIQDMITRFGTNELIRLSVPDGGDLTSVNQPPVALALGDSSQVIDTYLRRRYQVPVAAPVPAELNRACCIMARYDLSFGDGKEPAEQVRLARKEVMAWLESIRDGMTVLDGAIPSGDESYAMVSDRGFTTYQDDGDPTGANTFSDPPTNAPTTWGPGFWDGPLP